MEFYLLYIFIVVFEWEIAAHNSIVMPCYIMVLMSRRKALYQFR